MRVQVVDFLQDAKSCDAETLDDDVDELIIGVGKTMLEEVGKSKFDENQLCVFDLHEETENCKLIGED